MTETTEYNKKEMNTNPNDQYYQTHPVPEQSDSTGCGASTDCISGCATCMTCGLNTLIVGCVTSCFALCGAHK